MSLVSSSSCSSHGGESGVGKVSPVVAAALGLLLAAGCYAPSPPSGAYSCGSGGACPDGQHCRCGQCVRADEDAACAFTAMPTIPTCVDWPVGDSRDKPATCIHEHEPFPLDVTALQGDGKTPATGFLGGVTLSSSWGDAALAKGSPTRFSGGKATLMVTLNRETIFAGGARITVRAGTGRGTSRYIAVVPPRWTLDPQQVTLSPGWSDLAITDPAVIRAPGGYRMYFSGVGRGPSQAKPLVQGVGVAVSSDGVGWAVRGGGPAIASAAPEQPARWLQAPSPFRAADGSWHLLYRGAGENLAADVLGASSSDGLSGFTAAAAPVVKHGSCNYCASALSPSVVLAPDGTNHDFDLYFLTVRGITTGGMMADVTSLGHAVSSDDGASWDVDPVAVLVDSPSGTGERMIFAPRVVVDGSVYKVFYASAPGFLSIATLDPCGAQAQLQVAYATSTDGVEWIRSPSTPVVAGAVPWAAGVRTIVPGSVVLNDPTDPGSGYTMFYSTFQKVAFTGGTIVCTQVGVGRATRP